MSANLPALVAKIRELADAQPLGSVFESGPLARTTRYNFYAQAALLVEDLAAGLPSEADALVEMKAELAAYRGEPAGALSPSWTWSLILHQWVYGSEKHLAHVVRKGSVTWTWFLRNPALSGGSTWLASGEASSPREAMRAVETYIRGVS